MYSAITSLARGSLCLTLVKANQESLDIFNTIVSGQPEKEGPQIHNNLSVIKYVRAYIII